MSPNLWTIGASYAKPTADYQPSLFRQSKANSVEERWCQRLASGRLPEYIAKVATLHMQDLPKIWFEIVTHFRLCKR